MTVIGPQSVHLVSMYKYITYLLSKMLSRFIIWLYINAMKQTNIQLI